MTIPSLKIFLSENKLISVLVVLSLISSLRVLFIPLFGDETTYAEIAKNALLHGQYYFNEKPSSITPSFPAIIAFFYTGFNPEIGFAMANLLNLLFIVTGLKYVFIFLKKIEISRTIIWAVLLLTITNTNFVLWSLPLYPEALLFCFFWMFLYYYTESWNSPYDALPFFIAFVVLILTRYLYAVLGILVLLRIYEYFKELNKSKDYRDMKLISLIVILCFIPVLFWFKYVFYIETEVEPGLSYFHRFKSGGIWKNIMAGIGIVRHSEAGNINGIPAFITLFIPVTGLRNWPVSVIFIAAFCGGYILRRDSRLLRTLFVVILLIMGGLIFAGTGFSRYWVILLPGFILGFYLLWNKLNLPDSKFLILAKLIAVIYVVNELRIDFLIFNNHS